MRNKISYLILAISAYFYLLAIACDSFWEILLYSVITSVLMFISEKFHENTEKWLTIFAVVWGIALIICISRKSGWWGFIIPTLIYALSHLNYKSSSQMTGLEYEQHCADWLRKKGFYNIQVTPASNDYGADVIAEKNGERWVFQCKHYSGVVPNDAVQEINTAKKHYNAKKGAVITNSKLSENAKRLAWENDIELFEMID